MNNDDHRGNMFVDLIRNSMAGGGAMVGVTVTAIAVSKDDRAMMVI